MRGVAGLRGVTGPGRGVAGADGRDETRGRDRSEKRSRGLRPGETGGRGRRG